MKEQSYTDLSLRGRMPAQSKSTGGVSSILQDTGPQSSKASNPSPQVPSVNCQHGKEAFHKVDDAPPGKGNSALQDSDEAQPESNEQLIIAVDFGASSSAAYLFADERESEPFSIIYEQMRYTVPANIYTVPTEISYDAKDHNLFTWGAQEHKGNQPIFHPNLMLDPDQPEPLFVLTTQRHRTHPPPAGKAAVDVVADFLRAIFTHAVSQIEDTFFKDYVIALPKKFVLTVPAVWSDKARYTLLRAANKAGVSPITLVRQPEAIAKYCLHKLKDEKLNVGDAFVVCDAGSGTTDLISYEITQLVPLKLKELVPATGGILGSRMLTRRFEEAVKNLVGDEEFFRLRKTVAFEFASKQFDQEAVPAFRGDNYRGCYITFPRAHLEDDPSNDLEADSWNLKSGVMKAIFDPVISGIEKLLKEQIGHVALKRSTENRGLMKASDTKAIFLVGEFGGKNEYLRWRLGATFPNIRVIQPPDVVHAGSHGAALSQLSNQKRIKYLAAVMNFGFACATKYDKSTDAGQPKVWSSILGAYEVSKMKWHLEIGQDIAEGEIIRIPFTQIIPFQYDNSDLIFEHQLLTSDNLIPPIYPSPLETKINCRLEVDLSGADIDRSSFKRIIGGDCQPYREVCYEIGMEYVDRKYTLLLDGKEVGSLTPIYD